MLKLLAAIAVLGVLVAGCGSDERTPASTPAPTPSPEPERAAVKERPRFEKGHSAAVRKFYGGGQAPADPHGDVEAEYHQPPRPATGGIGDTITLTGLNIGVRMRVTVTGLVDPAEAERPPRAGMRYVGVGLRLRSTGITVHDSRLMSARLQSDTGRPAEPVFGVRAECSRGFDGVVFVDVGARAAGCLLFEVPEGARPRRLQLALEQLPAEVGGRWRLR